MGWKCEAMKFGLALDSYCDTLLNVDFCFVIVSLKTGLFDDMHWKYKPSSKTIEVNGIVEVDVLFVMICR